MSSPPRRLPAKPAPRRKSIPRIAFAIILLAALFWLRPLLYPLLFRFYAAPVVWLLPLLIFAGGGALAARTYRRTPKMDIIDERTASFVSMLPPGHPLRRLAQSLGRAAGVLMASAVLAFAVFFVMGILNGPLVSLQLYSHTDFQSIEKLPAAGAVRLTPKEVGERVAGSGFNSPTEHLTDFHLIRRDGHLYWTALRTPDGAYRSLAQRTAGILELNASASTRQTKLVDAEFKTAPGMYFTDNLTWRLRKKRFFAELDDPIALADTKGKPLIAVPYMKYKGWLIRRPAFGGVFIVRPDGKIDDLSPAQAQRHPALQAAGRAFPDSLARRLQESYAYKNGLFNKWFSHEDQTQISHTETNPQPYLMDFGKGGLQFVSAAEPYGKAFAVNAIFLTDSLSGRTRLWQPGSKSDLTGNRRVLETVRSLSIPGIVFTETTRNTSGDRGGFRVIEPRPLVVNGKLVFMTSIVPDSANNVSKTVFIDAATNRVAAVFDNDSDSQADEKIERYVRGGAGPGADGAATGGQASGATGAVGSTGEAGSTGTAGATGTKKDQQERLDELIRRQREILNQLEDLRDEIGR
ncbi:MAG: hypothetical protein HY827_03645 [Actinobacteria bacterium]|nr:hypothetical protein [Actinomycetota bacterium]